jgi:hypothetical protein
MLGMKIRATRGRTWVTAESEDFLTHEFLDQIGKLLVDSIVFEARKDLAKQGGHATPHGIAEGIPASERFFRSFYFAIEDSTVVVYSSWPQIEQVVEGRRPYPMTWVTAQEGFTKLPMSQGDGTVLVRTTPTSARQAWIHPGFRKHNFIRRGYLRARRQMDQLIAKQVTKVLNGMNVI